MLVVDPILTIKELFFTTLKLKVGDPGQVVLLNDTPAKFQVLPPSVDVWKSKL
jgi:hypothetical protein